MHSYQVRGLKYMYKLQIGFSKSNKTSKMLNYCTYWLSATKHHPRIVATPLTTPLEGLNEINTTLE